MNNDLDNKFNKIVNIINNSTKNDNLSNNIKLDFYKFYKQSTIGNCNTDKPNFLNFEGCLKWEAWNSCKDMEKDDAKLNYIDLYNATI